MDPPADTRAPPIKTCAPCKADIRDEYFVAGGQTLCGRCAASLTRRPQGSRWGAFFKALGLGFVGALFAAGLWAAVVLLTGYEVGLIAIVVGLIVGFAVRAGASGHRGLRFQFLAMALTFSSLSWSTIPLAIKELKERPPSEPAEQATPAPTGQAPGAGEAEIVVGALLLALLILPFVMYVGLLAGSPISILFLGIALYEAWKINQGRQVDVSGPHPVSGEIDFSKP